MTRQAQEQLHRTYSGSIPEYYDRYLGPAWFEAIAADLVARIPSDPGGDVLEKVTEALEAAGGRGLAFKGTCRVIAVEARADRAAAPQGGGAAAHPDRPGD